MYLSLHMRAVQACTSIPEPGSRAFPPEDVQADLIAFIPKFSSWVACITDTVTYKKGVFQFDCAFPVPTESLVMILQGRLPSLVLL